MPNLDQFLLSVQGKAYAQAKYAVGGRDEALDIVQDAMLKLARRYANNSQDEWPMLFQRILQNQIRDWYRKQKVRRVIFWWEQYRGDEEEEPLSYASQSDDPSALAQTAELGSELGQLVSGLPERQKQVFLLRALWGHSVDETANILGEHAGTVKTHYLRAVKVLKSKMEIRSC